MTARAVSRFVTSVCIIESMSTPALSGTRRARAVVGALLAKDRLFAHHEIDGDLRAHLDAEYTRLVDAIDRDRQAVGHLAVLADEMRRLDNLLTTTKRRVAAERLIAECRETAQTHAAQLAGITRMRLQRHVPTVIRAAHAAPRRAAQLPPPTARAALVSAILTAAPPAVLPPHVLAGAVAA